MIAMRRALLALSLIALPLFAATPLPPYAEFPPMFVSDPGYERIEAFGREEFPMPNDGLPKTVEGKHWTLQLRAEPPAELDADPTWDRLQRYLTGRGWQLVRGEAGSKVLHLRANGIDAWMKVDIFNSEDVRVSLVEVALQALKLTLPPPASQVERVASASDFPYLGHVPGSQLKESQTDNGPMDVTTDHDQEPQLAGTSSTVKLYTVPEQLGTHQFLVAYRDALTAAGWAIVTMAEPSDGVLLAHYGKNGRDVWASLHINADEISMRVADNDLASQLAGSCHAALYGVHFDVNKPALRPDSDATLQQVLALLQANPALSIELQGHTDAVGDDAANQLLSEARAASVRAWLTQRGVDGKRITAKGYGKTKPVATNDTDEGKARNRRVEIVKAGCS
jgi:outer membrane protein OmpA-like peptidoglycan-associated protein